jgi:ABC-type branched-subunit amino acid transport system substrate-binding protein
MIPRSRAVAAFVATGLLALGACGTDAVGGAPGTTVVWKRTMGGTWDGSVVDVSAADLECGGRAPDPTRGVTASSVTIGGLGTLSGPTVAVYADSDAGARARFERANAEGGVHGRKVEYVGMEDDGLDPTRQVDAARRLVTRGVFAAAPVMSQLPNFKQPFCDAVMPHFGWGFNAGWCNTAIGFAFTGCILSPERTYLAISSGSVDDLVKDQPKTIALIGNEEEAARIGNETLKLGFESSGYKVVYAENPLNSRAPIADASPIVNSIMTADEGAPPSFVYLVADFANSNTMVEAFRAAGYDGSVLSAVGYDPRLAQAPQFQGIYTTLQWAPFESADIPFVAQMVKDFERYAPDTARGLPAAGGYIAADMVVAALQAAGPDLTVDSFVRALNDRWVYSTPGFRGDATFPANHVIAVPCGTLVLLQNERFQQGGPITCTDPVKRS